MRTSKKILSLFLAVVMVITTCSVGFTAFAKDYDNIWSDSSEAEDAFKALNGLADEYLPSALMGIEAVSNGVYKKYAKEMGKDVKALTDAEKKEIASKATLQDILTALQPTLIGALAGESQEEYAKRVGGSNPKNPSYYDYLIKYVYDSNGNVVMEGDGDPIGKDEQGNPIYESYKPKVDKNTLDFFSLYALCADYRTNTNLSRETRNQLDEWYFQLRKIYNLGVSTDVEDKVEDKIEALEADFEDPFFGSPWNSASLEALRAFYTEDYLNSKCDAEILAAFQTKYSELTEEYVGYGVPEGFEINDFAEFIYYGYGAGKNLKYAYAYTKAVEAAGEKMTFKSNEDIFNLNVDEDGNPLGNFEEYYVVDEHITPENVGKLITEAYFSFVMGEDFSFDDAVISMIGGDPSDPSSYDELSFNLTASEFEKTCIVSCYNKDGVFAQNYNKIIKGLTIQHSDDIADAAAFDTLVNAKMPANYKDGNAFTEDEIKTIASAMRSLNSANDVTSALKTGTVSGKDVFGVQIDTTLPSGMQSTYFGEYLAMINDKSQSNLDSTLQSYKLKIWNGFYSKYADTNFRWFLLNDDTPVNIGEVADKSQLKRDAATNLPVLNYDGASFDSDVINQIVLDAERYAYTQIAAEYLGISTFVRNSTTALNIDINYESFVKSKAPQKPEAKVELTAEQKAILYADYDLTGDVGTEIVDCILNGTVSGIVNNEIVAGIISGLVITDLDLVSALDHVWERICKDPVSTVFELVPVLVVLVDELILPLALNSGVPEGESYGSDNTGITFDMEAGILDYLTIDGDLLGGVLSGLLGKSFYFKDFSYDYGSYIGIKHLGWDLNVLLPKLMHWLLASKDDQKNKNVPGITYYVNENTTVPVYYTFYNSETTDAEQQLLAYVGTKVVDAKFDHYTIKDSLGNEITRKEVGKDAKNKPVYQYTYGGASSKDINAVLGADSTTEFNCYMTYEARVPYLTGIYLVDELLAGARVSDLGSLLGKKISDKNLANGLAEIIAELATLFGASVDEFVSSDRVNQIRYKKGNRLFAGLNNVFVALPQLIDIMEDLAADKYGIDRNAWTFCYDGKIATTTAGNLAAPEGKASTINKPLEDFKSYAGSSDKNRSVDILDGFVSLVIEDWLNAVISIVNNVVSTDNVISKNLPIVMSLLNSLGGFGEDSVFTDIFNGVFQLKRGDKNSFEFKVQENGLTGLSSENAYFLFSNIDTLVKVITALVESFKKPETTTPSVQQPTTPAQPVVATAGPMVKATTYTDGELKTANTLIEKLDKMIASLLANSTINDYNLANVGNTASGVVSLLSNYISAADAQSLVGLLDSYLFYLDGAGTRTADANGNLKPTEVYTNENLSDLTVRTFALLENIVQDLLKKQNYVYGDGENKKTYNLLASAINGVISPDSIGIRLDDYKDAQKSILGFKSWNSAIAPDGNLTLSAKNINWNVTAGNKDQFFKGFASSFRLVTSVLGVLLIDAGLYQNALYPILNTLGSYVGFTVDTPNQYADASNPYRDEVLLGIIKPVIAFLDKLLKAPFTTIIRTVQALAAILDDSNTKAGSIGTIVSNAIKPISNELLGAAAILKHKGGKLGATSPTLAAVVENLVNTKIAALGVTDANGALVNIKIKDVPLSGSNLIAIINTLLAKTGIVLNAIDWKALSEAKTPADALVYFLKYVLTVAKDNKAAIITLLGKSYTGVVKIILDALFNMDVEEILGIIGTILNFTQSPTEVYWSYSKYKSKLIKFTYPKGIMAEDADRAVAQLDNAVGGVFALLQGMGVVDYSNLPDLVNGLLFKNELLTQLAIELYGALDSESVGPYLEMAGIAVSPKEVSKLLKDKSYGKTFSSAAKTIGSKSSWKKLKTVKKDKSGKETTTYAKINWGFTNGAANAQQGFINALVAILRPLNDVLAVFLNSNNLELGDIAYNLVTTLDVKDTKLGDNATLTLQNGVLTITVVDAAKAGSKPSVIKMDLKSLELLKDLKLCGTNGYNSVIIPLLEVFGCDGIVTEAQYKKHIAAAKDNLLLDVLNPLMSFINKVLEAPFDTITGVLPNVAYFIDNNGIGQLLNNLLAPITELLKSAKKAGLDIDKILTDALGKDVGTLLTEMLKMKGVKLNVKLTDLSSLNIQEVVVPLINSLLKKTGIKLPDFKWSTIAAHGEVVTSKSKAKNAQGKYTRKEVIADKGETLVAVLRYVASVLTTNAKTLKTLLGSIDAIKKNDTIKSVINSVFNTISTSSNDSIVNAVFYFFNNEPSNAFWDYTAYKTGEYSFSYPESVDTDFLKNLPPMLDGLIGGLADLNGLIGGALFKDDLVSKLAVGLYGAIEKVSISGDTTLTDLLAQTNIDFSTANVAKLLVDEDYGQTFPIAASVISNAGSWANVSADSLKWGVNDRDSFFHALVAVLRPIYGVLDVLLNSASLGIFDIVRIPGSNGYTSSIVPLMEAFSMYNIKTQYQYRQDIVEAYDNILLDIINPLWDKIEDLLNAPLQTLAAMIPNLALFIGNDGLVQIIDNLLVPVSALVDAIKPIINLNDLLDVVFDALNVDLGSILGKIGITNFSLDIYDLSATLKPILGGDAIIPLINNILGIIKIGGQPLGLKLNPVDWLQLASHGKTIVSASQAATYGARIYVEGDSSETLIAVLRYLIETVNAGDNFDKISSLVGGLLGDGASDTVTDVINQVLGALQGDTDEVIAALVDLLQMLA